MTSDLAVTIRILSDIETNIGLLYRAFASGHDKDAAFWLQIADEEIHHSEMLMSLENYILDTPSLYSLFSIAPESLQLINSKILSLIDSCTTKPFERQACFTVAIQLEQSAGEIHFQKSIAGPETDVALQVLQALSTDDQNHVQRIKEYMAETV